MEFTPKTEEEIMELSLPPEGKYFYRTKPSTEQRIDKNGNEYFLIKLVIEKDDPEFKGKRYFINDFLYFEGRFLAKTKHYCESNGMKEFYDKGNIPIEELDYRSGKLILEHRINKNYGEKQAFVKDYVKSEKTNEDFKKEFEEDIFF